MPSSSDRRLTAVIFDVDGTLVDSEQSGHRVAFNETFAAFGLPDRWDPNMYRGLLTTTGGEARLLEWFRHPASSVHGKPAGEQRGLARLLHAYKTSLFREMAASGAIPARDGVLALLDELSRNGVLVAVATTGTREWVRPLLDQLFSAGRFATIVTGDDVRKRKPDAAAYLVALERCGLRPCDAVAVEDSGAGVAAARAAGLPCIVVVNPETNLDAVADADLVVSAFGSDLHPMTVVADPHRVVRGPRLSMSTITAVWAAGRAHATAPTVRRPAARPST